MVIALISLTFILLLFGPKIYACLYLSPEEQKKRSTKHETSVAMYNANMSGPETERNVEARGSVC